MNESDAMPGTLHIVAVPIGNIRDITYRAVDTLRNVDLIAAEDTRDFRALQREYGIETRAISYHDFNEQPRSEQLVGRLLAGESVALVSDAGTPLINDPGFRIVAAAIEAGVPVTSLPGPCAAITALAVSGLPVSSFLFLGFPPRTGSKRRRLFRSYVNETATLVFYEAPHRLFATLTDLREIFGDRHACLARNITKPHERYQRGTISILLDELVSEDTVRGEATVIVAGSETLDDEPAARACAEEQIREWIAGGVDSRTILDRIMSEYGLKRREAYEMILKAKV